MYDPIHRHGELITLIEFEKAISIYKRRIAELEKENQQLKEELKNVRQ